MLRASACSRPGVLFLILGLLPFLLAGSCFTGAAAPRGTMSAAYLGRRLLFPRPGERIMELTSCDVEGDLDLHGKTVSVEIRFANVHFRGSVNCQRTHFTERVSFAARPDLPPSEFRNGANFDDTEFDRAAIFSMFRGEHQNQRGTMSGTVFGVKTAPLPAGLPGAVPAREDEASRIGAASFQRAIFHEAAWFDGADFGGSRTVSASSAKPGRWLPPLVRFDGAQFRGRAEFRSATFAAHKGRVSFSDVAFGDEVDFSYASFPDRVGFRNASFAGSARFVRANFNGGGANARRFPRFSDCTFSGPVDFRLASLGKGGLVFENCWFQEAALFNQIDGGGGKGREGTLKFGGDRFHGLVSFAGTDVNSLQISAPVGPAVSEPAGNASTAFQDTVSFQGLQCTGLSLEGSIFRDYVSFVEARVAYRLNLTGATFGSDVSFQDADLPGEAATCSACRLTSVPVVPKRGDAIRLEGARFEGGLYADWERFGGKLGTRVSRTWEGLERAFRYAGDLKSQNRSMCRKRYWYLHEPAVTAEADGTAPTGGHDKELVRAQYTSRTESTDPAGTGRHSQRNHPWRERFLDALSRYFWGYGVKPGRVLSYLVFVFVLFGSVYAAKAGRLLPDPRHEERQWGLGVYATGWWYRIRFGLDFSWHNMIRLGWGYQRAQGTLFRGLTLFQSLLSKTMLVLLLKALANTNPSLRELGGSLLTF